MTSSAIWDLTFGIKRSVALDALADSNTAGNFPWLQLLLVFGSSCVYAVAALAVAVEAFKRESVLFRS